MAAATATAQFAAGNGDDLNPSLTQLRIGIDVAVIAHDHTGFERDDVVAVVLLLTLGDIGIAAGFHDAQLLQAKRPSGDLDQRLLFLSDVQRAGLFAGADRIGHDPFGHIGEDRDQIAVAQGEQRIKMHRGPFDGQLAGDDPFGPALRKQRAPVDPRIAP